MDRNFMGGQPSAPSYGFNYGQTKTNRILVSSLEEAVIRTNEYGSEMYYFDQNKPVFYIVRMDFAGRKTWAEVPYGSPAPDADVPVTRAELAQVLAKVEELEQRLTPQGSPKVKKNKTEVIENGESIG